MEEKFKKGDWVIIKEDVRKEIRTDSFDIPFQIDKLSNYEYLDKGRYLYKADGKNRYESDFRYALPHEIPTQIENYSIF